MGDLEHQDGSLEVEIPQVILVVLGKISRGMVVIDFHESK
jgi:hypothetical protein